MTVRKIADVTEEELEECESKELFDSYSQEFLYVKMTSRKPMPNNKGPKKRTRWPTLDQLRPKLKKASLLETSLEEEQVAAKPNPVKMKVKESGEFCSRTAKNQVCLSFLHGTFENGAGFVCFKTHYKSDDSSLMTHDSE